MVVTGNPETKNLKDMMPEILKQVGPQQYSFLKDIMGNMGSVKEAASKAEEDEDDVPELVGTNFEEASKQQWDSWGGVSQAVSYVKMNDANLLIPQEIFEYIFTSYI